MSNARLVRRPILLIFLCVLCATPIWFAACSSELPDCTAGAVKNSLEEQVLFFYDRGCPDCEVVIRDLLPRLLERERLTEEDVQWLDVGDPQTITRLLAIEAKLGFHTEVLAPVVIVGGKAYRGIKDLEAFFAEVENEPTP